MDAKVCPNNNPIFSNFHANLVIMRTATLLFLLQVLFHWTLAQTGEQTGGLVVKQLYVRDQILNQDGDLWVSRSLFPNQEKFTVALKHYLLDASLQPIGAELPWKSGGELGMDRHPYFPYAFFLQGNINGRPTPNHRVVFLLGRDTMTVDFLGVDRTPFNNPFVISSIYFKPGHFVFNQIGNPS